MTNTKTATWPEPWFRSVTGWRRLLRPHFVVPQRRQIRSTLFIHAIAAIASLPVLLLDALRRREAPRRILFVGRHHLGDVLMTLPALALARRHLPDAEMTLVVQERYRHDLDFPGFGFKTIPEIEGLGFLAEVKRWRTRISEGGYDAVVFHRITRPDFAAVLAAFLERVAHRVGGAEKGLQAFLTDIYAPQSRELVVEYHWNLIRAWLKLPAAAVELRWPRLVPSGETRSLRWDVLIAPFAQHTKEWPDENWQLLVDRCHQAGLRVALSAGPHQADRARKLVANLPEVMDLSATSQSLVDLFDNVCASRCVVSLDTGIRHVAAALGTPCVVIGHGREHMRLFGAYVPTERYFVHRVPCAPCGEEPCPLGHLQCVRGVSVDEIVDGIHTLVPGMTLASASHA